MRIGLKIRLGIIIYFYHFICIIILSTRRRESTFIGASTATGALVSIVIVFVCVVVCAFVSVLPRLCYTKPKREKKQMNVISVE